MEAGFPPPGGGKAVLLVCSEYPRTLWSSGIVVAPLWVTPNDWL